MLARHRHTSKKGGAMSADNEQLVTEFCHSLASGDMTKVVAYLSEDVFYHNMPWAPVNGHAGVHEVLDPFINENLLEKMEIKHTASSGDVGATIGPLMEAIQQS